MAAGAVFAPSAALAQEHHSHGHQYPQSWEIHQGKADGARYGLFLRDTQSGAVRDFELSGLVHHPGSSAYPSTYNASEHTLIYSTYTGETPSSAGKRQAVGNDGIKPQFDMLWGAGGDEDSRIAQYGYWDARVLYHLADYPVENERDAAAVALAIQTLVQRDRIDSRGFADQAESILTAAKTAGSSWAFGKVNADSTFTAAAVPGFTEGDTAGARQLAVDAAAIYDKTYAELKWEGSNLVNGTGADALTLAWDEGSNTSGTLTVTEPLTLDDGGVDLLDIARFSHWSTMTFEPALPDRLVEGETYHWTLENDTSTLVSVSLQWDELENSVASGLIYGDEQMHNLSAIHTFFSEEHQLTRYAPGAPTVTAGQTCGEEPTVTIPTSGTNRLFTYDQQLSDDGKSVTVTATPKSSTVRTLPGAQTEWVLELPEVEECAPDDVIVTPVAPTFITDVLCGEEARIELPEIEGVIYEQTRDGNTVTVTATPEEGYAFESGSGETGTETSWVYEIPAVEECAPEPIVATPVAPEFVPSDVCGEEGTIRVSETEGVIYEQSREGDTVTVTATPAEGYVFADDATTSWTVTIPEAEVCEPEPEPTPDPEPTPEPELPVATPVAPALSPVVACGEEAVVVITDVEGVVYEQNREGNTVTVTATPAEGYRFAEGTVSNWTLEIPEVVECETPDPELTPEPEPTPEPELPVATPEAPRFEASQVCGEEGVVVIPETEGVVYEQSRDGNTVTVTATPEDGYRFEDGQVTSWTFEIPAAESCETPAPEPEKPTEPENPVTPVTPEEPKPELPEEPVAPVEPEEPAAPEGTVTPEKPSEDGPAAKQPVDAIAPEKPAAPALSATGGDISWLALGGAGALLLAGGAAVLVTRRNAKKNAVDADSEENAA